MNKILVCDVSGNPHHWCSWQDGVVLKYKELLSYELGDASVFHGGTSRTTGARSQVNVGQILFLKEVLKYDHRTPPLTNENLFIRDLNICGYCGRRYPSHKLSRDHIHPTSDGGKNAWQNCVTACKPCNHAKDDNALGVARDSDGELMKLLYVPYVPSHAERLLMQNRNILADQMSFIKDFLPQHSRILQNNNILRLDDVDVGVKSHKVKRHFYSADEMAQMKRNEAIENSRRKRIS